MLVPALCIFLLVGVQAARPDGDSGFFLKAPKSVPRAGRSAPGQYDGFFLKASKSVPRVGRRDGSRTSMTDDGYPQWQKENQQINDGWKYSEGMLPSFPEELLYNLDVPSNYPAYSSEIFDKNLSHRSRRYNVATFLHANKMEGQLGNYNQNLNGEIEGHYQNDL